MFPGNSIENTKQFTKEKTYNRCILPECNAMKKTDFLSQSPDRQDAAAEGKTKKIKGQSTPLKGLAIGI